MVDGGHLAHYLSGSKDPWVQHITFYLRQARIVQDTEGAHRFQKQVMATRICAATASKMAVQGLVLRIYGIP